MKTHTRLITIAFFVAFLNELCFAKKWQSRGNENVPIRRDDIKNPSYWTSPPPIVTKTYAYRFPQNWVKRESANGYKVGSNVNIPMFEKTFEDEQKVRIRVELGTAARFLQTTILGNRMLELQVSEWNKEKRIGVIVPEGQNARDLEVVEHKSFLDIFLPM